MKIYPSILAADIFGIETWLEKMHWAEAIHVDLVDPSFADCVGVDSRIIEKLHQRGIKTHIHYMATWNENFIRKLMQFEPLSIFFHQKHIGNIEFFRHINGNIALELNEEPIIDCAEYIVMNVIPGTCGQQFDNANLELSKRLKNAGKTVISDGGINQKILPLVQHCDVCIMGSSLLLEGDDGLQFGNSTK